MGGFAPSLLSGTGQTYNLHFDDTGATLDQVYTGTLTLSSTDEPLPGSAAQPDLVVTLRAKPTSTVTGVGPSDRPTTLAFYPPAPNPLQHEANFAFDLPNDAPVNLAIFDLGGRRIATHASCTLPAARLHITWGAGRDAGRRFGRPYFARFDTPGLTTPRGSPSCNKPTRERNRPGQALRPVSFFDRRRGPGSPRFSRVAAGASVRSARSNR